MAGALDTATQDLNQQIGRTSDGNQYLTFQLGEEFYGIDILRVQEIKGYTAVTRIPNTPAHIKGVLNLRGTIVPVVELRTKFGMPTIDYTSFTVVIIVVVNERVVGLVVDSVSDVLNIASQNVQSAPQLGTQIDVSFLTGIGKCGDKLVSLLDVDRLLNDIGAPCPLVE